MCSCRSRKNLWATWIIMNLYIMIIKVCFLQKKPQACTLKDLYELCKHFDLSLLIGMNFSCHDYKLQSRYKDFKNRCILFKITELQYMWIYSFHWNDILDVGRFYYPLSLCLFPEINRESECVSKRVFEKWITSPTFKHHQ